MGKNRKNHFFWISILILILSVFFGNSALGSDAQNLGIIITEIASNEPSDTEWIEIFNGSSSSINLSGWKFFEENTNHSLSAFRGDLSIEPQEYAVIANKADSVAQKYPQFTGALIDSSWGNLKEDGEEIGIKDSSGIFAENFIFPQSVGTTSIERINITLTAAAPTNWRNHSSSNSIGNPTAITQNNADNPAESSNESTEGTTTQVDNIGNSTSQSQGTSTESAIIAEAGTTTTSGTTTSGSETALSTTNGSGTLSRAQNLPPQAIIQIQSGYLIAEGETTINFDGRSSFDPDGEGISFLWDMGDGTLASTANPGPHKFSSPGVYMVTLIVIDSAGLQNSASQLVQVLNNSSQTAASPNSQATVSVPASQNQMQQIQPAQQSPNHNIQSAQNTNAGQTAQNNIAREFSLEPNLGSLSILLSQLQKFPQINFQIEGSVTIGKNASIKIKTTSQKKKTAKKTDEDLPDGNEGGIAGNGRGIAGNGTLSDSIKITEIFPAPVSGEEWIEIFNAGDEDVALGNWTIKDNSKTSYKISDEVILKPHEYKIFLKSETKISLNNDKDTVTLMDFENQIADQVLYDAAQKGQSYALVQTIGADQNGAENAWEWMDFPTPAKPNPRMEKISGYVNDLKINSDENGGVIEITTKTGEGKKISFSEKIWDPKIAQVTLAKGADIEVSAQKQSDDSYLLHKMIGIKPAEPQSEENKKSRPLWLEISAFSSVFLFLGWKGLKFFVLGATR